MMGAILAACFCSRGVPLRLRTSSCVRSSDIRPARTIRQQMGDADAGLSRVATPNQNPARCTPWRPRTEREAAHRAGEQNHGD
jgi:hypothetical protein